MFDFFRKKRKSQVDPLTAADWLANMLDALAEKVREFCTQPHSEPPQLALFTVSQSVVTAGNLLRLVPASVVALGSILLELRLYYDCLWQLDLLSRFADKDKIAKLYALVEMAETNLWRIVFENNPRFSKLVGRVIEGHRREGIIAATRTYIHGELTAREIEFVKKLCDSPQNCALLMFRILAILEEENIKVSKEQFGDCIVQLSLDTFRSISYKLLLQFDLDNCKVIEFPPDFYEQ